MSRWQDSYMLIWDTGMTCNCKEGFKRGHRPINECKIGLMDSSMNISWQRRPDGSHFHQITWCFESSSVTQIHLEQRVETTLSWLRFHFFQAEWKTEMIIRFDCHYQEISFILLAYRICVSRFMFTTHSVFIKYLLHSW